jgi:HEAT repeat protein
MITDTNIIKKALLNVGIEINDIYDLVNARQEYSKAIPVLIELLEKDIITNDKVKEGIIRALAIKEARGKAGKVLIEEFNKTPKEKALLRWIIGNTMETIISDEELPDILEIVNNKDNGMARQMFVIALGNLKNKHAEYTLINLLNDDIVAPQAIQALAKLKSIIAKEKIDQLQYHPKLLIRKEAQKALKKLKSI